MSAIRPFQALRPVAEVAARVSSVPYDVVNTEEARAQAEGNPLSFLHVTRPEIDLPPGTDPHADEVYAQAVRSFEELRRAAPLTLDPEPGFYFYRLRAGGHEQTGLAACYSIDEYEQGLIKKHELTRRDKEDDRTRHMVDLRAQTGVVFLTYRASAEVDEIARRASAAPPLYDFTAEDGVTHTLWRVVGRDADALTAAFARVPALYIADGHHRAASAARTRTVLRRDGGTGEFDTMLAVAFPGEQVRILPYNRIVKDLAGRSPAEFLEAVRAKLPLRPGGPAPAQKGEASMYLDGRWYTLDLSAAGQGGTDPIDRLDRMDRIDQLGVSILQRVVLADLLKIGDVRSDPRIDFVGGARGTAALEQAVDGGRAAVAFSLYPVTVDDLMAISDAGGIMPPKSTWFEPKLRDGLIVHLI